MIDISKIEAHNVRFLDNHQKRISATLEMIPGSEWILNKLIEFQIAIPSWALGTGGTRFGRFPGGGEPGNIYQKIQDVALLHQLTGSCESVSLHIPWDIPENPEELRTYASRHNIRFDSVNSNTFQDQPGQTYSYKFGSLHHTSKSVRLQAIAHNIDVIRTGISLGSSSLTVWLSDGSCFPGQLNFREAFERTRESMEEIYAALPEDWTMLIEYKAFEPNFYSMTIGDWGTSFLLAGKLGKKAKTLVDLGHHLPNANIEQIVAILLMEKKLGGFHFNDSKYGDDDLTAGSVKPYQLFLIFHELVQAFEKEHISHMDSLAWMIDASHNIKDPLEDLLQSVDAILLAYAQALLVDRSMLAEAQQQNDVVRCQQILQDAFRTDLRPLVAEARLRAGGAIDPVGCYRSEQVRKVKIRERGLEQYATGL